MIFSPIEQFEIFEFIIDAICLRSKFSISLSNYSLTILCFSGLLLLLGISFFLINAKVPTRAQLAYYRYLSIVRGIIQDLLSPQVAKIYFFTLVLFVFFFINFLNLMGLIPYTIAITAQFSVTFLIAFLFFLTINLTGLYYHGFDMLRLFYPQGTPLAILPLLVIIEIISYFARIFSLSIRLFANLTAGHILLKILSWFIYTLLQTIFAGVIGIALISILWSLEFFICILQAYVFVILLCIYLNEVLQLH